MTRKETFDTFKIVDFGWYNSVMSEVLSPLRGKYVSVTGPGRSGAVAAVCASYFLQIPYVVPKQIGAFKTPARLAGKLLIIDSAWLTGKTLRKMSSWYNERGIENDFVFLFKEDKENMYKFFYESTK